MLWLHSWSIICLLWWGLLATISGEREEKELLKLYKEGDNEALAILFKRYYGVLLHIAAHGLKDGSYKEDLIQDIALIFFRKSIEERQKLNILSFLSFFSLVVKRKAYSHGKKKEVNQAENKTVWGESELEESP